jgi:diguanylate cyclase (GGDEF)-like protein
MPMALVILFFTAMLSVSAWRAYQLIHANLEANVGRRHAERELEREALFDPLTNLPNRRYFLDRLQQEFSRALRHERTGALLFLDLDNFKTINDSLGHHVGDQLLQQVASRLKGRFRDEDVAGRLGGDEFVVLLADVVNDPVSTIYEVEKVTSQLKDLLTEPYRLDEHELFVSVSIGVALFPGEADSYRDVLKHADTAMYRAKAQGRNSYQFFLPGMQEEASRRLTIEKDLRRALAEDQLELHYQPQVDEIGDIVGLEALARWRHPTLGNVPPSTFVPIADESTLVHEFHDWVVVRVCRDIRRMIEQCGIDALPVVSINVSARTFHHASFEQQLLEQITRAGIPPDRLCLEITETSVMERVETVIDKMLALRQSGILFSIDDFGTGYSSLAYLKRLPVDSLKIDRTFVRDITTDPNDAVIVETILSMADHLGIKVIAEGVENEPTAEFLRERGCGLFQGWLYGKPLPLEEALEGLHRRD